MVPINITAFDPGQTEGVAPGPIEATNDLHDAAGRFLGLLDLDAEDY